MTYIELYEKATRQLEKSEITLGEYEEMIKPLNREIITCKDCIHYDKELKECMVNNIQCNANFSCKDGERKEYNGRVYRQNTNTLCKNNLF